MANWEFQTILVRLPKIYALECKQVTWAGKWSSSTFQHTSIILSLSPHAKHAWLGAIVLVADHISYDGYNNSSHFTWTCEIWL